MTQNFITYENYERHKTVYGHIGTYGLWNDTLIENKGKDLNTSLKEREKLLIANSNEEYIKKGLDKILHGEVIFLQKNFSMPKDDSKNDYHQILLNSFNKVSKVDSYMDRYNQLTDLVKRNKSYLYYNIHDDAAGNYGPGFMKHDILRGSYITDFVKIVKHENQFLPSGVIIDESQDDSSENRLKEELTVNLDIHAKGLKEELDLLGVKPKVIVLCHHKLKKPKIKEAIEKELGYKPRFETLPNYESRAVKKKEKDSGIQYNSAAEAFEHREIKDLVSRIEDYI